MPRIKSPAELEERALKFIKANNLLSRKQKLVVAVSGGPDSSCLLHVLFKLQPKLDVSLHVAHLNHKLRKDESDEDARYVIRLAGRLGIPVSVEEYDVRSYKTERRISLEEAAREIRYNFLARIAKSVGTGVITVGHTLDDHIETVLLHLIRGSGTNGLRGLQPLRVWGFPDQVEIIRPLLEISREETARYCQENQLEPRLDVSNLSLSPLRNKIRLQLIPLLKSYNPGIVQALERTSRITADDFDLISKETERLWGEVVLKQTNGIELDKEKFGKAHPALQRQALRKAIEELAGNLKDVESRHIEQLIQALNKPAGKRLNLPENLTFFVDYEKYRLSPCSLSAAPFPELSVEYHVRVPGKTLLPGWKIKAEIFEASMGKELVERAEKTPGREFTVFLDMDKVGDNLTVRKRKPGDRFQPLGMAQPKKVNRFMIDARIPRAWRDRVPVFDSEGRIVWVAGWRIDERVKVTDDTGRVLRLEMRRTDNEPGKSGRNSREAAA